MKTYDVIVVGGSAAGVTAAITARRHYPEKSILLIRKEKQVPIPCGIPYIFGTVGDPQKNLIPGNKINGLAIKMPFCIRNGIFINIAKVMLNY